MSNESKRLSAAQWMVCGIFMTLMGACGGTDSDTASVSVLTATESPPATPSAQAPTPEPPSPATATAPTIPSAPTPTARPRAKSVAPHPRASLPQPTAIVTMAWAAEQTLVAGGALIGQPAIGANGRPAVSTSAAAGGAVSRQWYSPDHGWSVSAEVNRPPLATGAVRPVTRLATSGDWAAAAWAEQSAPPAAPGIWVQVSGPGVTAPAMRVSSNLPAEINSVQLTMSPDGGATVVWIERHHPLYSDGRLVSRHWSPAAGWTAISEHETHAGLALSAEQLQRLPDGRALLLYGKDVQGLGSVSTHLWGRMIETSGRVGAAVRLDDPTPEVSWANEVQTVLRGEDVVVSWRQSTYGPTCIGSRVLHNGTWSAHQCANGTASSDSLWMTQLAVDPAGRISMSWSDRGIHGAELGDNGQWSAPQPLSTALPTERDDWHYARAACRDGSTALAWMSTADDTHEHLISLRVRAPDGHWGQRMALSRYGSRELVALRLATDDACNWTAAWAMDGAADSTDGVYARRLLASTGLQPTEPLAEGITMPWSVPFSGGYAFDGRLELTVEATGQALVLWTEQAQDAVKWRRLE